MTRDTVESQAHDHQTNAVTATSETVLVATVGTSPPVLTETVWALAHRSPPVVVDRVIVVTTLRGKDLILSQLLHANPSPWKRLQALLSEKGNGVSEKPRLVEEDILVISSSKELEDIRTKEDNQAVGNQILKTLLQLSASPSRTIYLSIAGGRKTMSSLALAAMTLCARPQDRVFHVLVNQPFDNARLDPPFFFPDPDVPYYQYEDNGKKKRISYKDAHIELAEIPIPAFSEFLEFVSAEDRKNLTLDAMPMMIRRASEEAVTQRLFNQPIEVDECLAKTPLIKWLGDSLCDRSHHNKMPFSELHVLMVLHCLANLVSFTNALQKLGLKKATFFVKEYPYPQKEQICTWLKSHGYEVCELNEDVLTNYLKQLDTTKQYLIIEDGGWITKSILEKFPALCSQVIGVMEQTTKGLWRIDEAMTKLSQDAKAKLFPILVLPHSRHKLDFEPLHIGRGIVRAIDQMIPDYLDGMDVAVFGYGSIGKNVAKALDDMGAHVEVYDPEFRSKTKQSGHSHVKFGSTPEETARGKRLIIGCSGSVSIDDKVIASIQSKKSMEVYLASGSSEKVEIDISSLKRMSKRETPFEHPYLTVNGRRLRLGARYELPLANIVLLGDGMPVNFMGLGGMKDPAADFIMSLMLAGAYKLACRAIPGNGFVCQKDNSCIDRIAEELGIREKFDRIWEEEY